MQKPISGEAAISDRIFHRFDFMFDVSSAQDGLADRERAFGWPSWQRTCRGRLRAFRPDRKDRRLELHSMSGMAVTAATRRSWSRFGVWLSGRGRTSLSPQPPIDGAAARLVRRARGVLLLSELEALNRPLPWLCIGGRRQSGLRIGTAAMPSCVRLHLPARDLRGSARLAGRRIPWDHGPRGS